MTSRSLRLSALLALLFALLLAAPAFAQNQSTVLEGQVTDQTGAVVPDAQITVTSATQQTFTATSNHQGNYSVRGLAPGAYTVTVLAKGFAPFSSPDLAIGAKKTQTLDIPLEIQVEQKEINVEAQGASVDVNPSNNASSVILKGKDLDALSDDPDELQDELNALAGPAAGPNGGQIYIDGFTGGTLPPKSAIREIRINQNPFSAEYDKLGYGRIEVFTKPGTDNFHGQFFINGNSSAFNSKNPKIIGAEPDYDTEQYNGNIGGPLSKKASFFFSVDRRNINEEAIGTGFTLDNNFNQVPFSTVLPSPRTRMNLSPRIDYQLTPNNSITFRYQYETEDQRNDGIGQFALASQAYNSSSRENSFQLSDTQILGSKAVNETRFRYQRESSTDFAVSNDPTVNVLQSFIGGGNSIGTDRTGQGRYELQNYTSIASGNHFIKFGARIRITNQTNVSTPNFNGSFSFSSLDAYSRTLQGLAQGLNIAQIRANYAAQGLEAGPNQFSLTTGTPTVANTYADAGLYAEDDWKLRPNMTLSYGLRYETQNAINDHKDFAPRLGFAWGIGGGKGGSPKTVLRVGYGIFYDRVDQDLILNAARLNGTTQLQYSVTQPDFYPTIPDAATIAALSPTSPTTYRLASSIRAPYTMQTGVSLERQLGKIGTLSFTYLHARGVHQLLSVNANAPLLGTYDPANPASGVRPFGNVGNIYQYVSEGIFKQNQFITNFNVRVRSALSLFGYYTLNYANSDTSGAGSFPTNSYDISQDYGRAAFDTRNRLFMGGTWSLPYNFRVSPFLIATSGRPFNITVGRDLNGDFILNDRPTFATGACQLANCSYGNFDTTQVAGSPLVPVNYATGPGQFSLNLRVSKTWGFGKETGAHKGGPDGPTAGAFGRPQHGGHDHGRGGGVNTGRRYNVTFSVAGRNIFNNVNLANPVGNVNSNFFGQSISLAGGFFNSSVANRRIDLQLLFSF